MMEHQHTQRRLAIRELEFHPLQLALPQSTLGPISMLSERTSSVETNDVDSLRHEFCLKSDRCRIAAGKVGFVEPLRFFPDFIHNGLQGCRKLVGRGLEIC